MIVACSGCSHRFEGGGYRDERCPACGAIALATRTCPRCASPLTARRVEELVFDECGRCGGVFLDHASIERAVAEHAEDVLASLPPTGVIPTGYGQSAPTCPTCGVAMEKRMASGGSGIIIDVCKQHGVFFDAGELRTLITFAHREAARSQREGNIRYTGHAGPLDGDADFADLVATGGVVAAGLLAGPVGAMVATFVMQAIVGSRGELKGNEVGGRNKPPGSR